MNTRKPDFRFNESGYRDNTSFEALMNIRREERKQLIYEIKALANKHGYRIVSIIKLRELDGDKND